MNLQTFLPYVPFLAVLYALFAFVQALRHKQQGSVATLLALVSFGVPFIAYIVVSDATIRASLIQFMLINAGIVFAASLLTLLIERRNPRRNSNHSYGMLGLGLSVLLAVAMFVLPLAVPTTSASTPTIAAANTTNSNGQTVLVSNETSNSASVQPEATQSADSTSSTPTAVAQALTAQTGLSAADLLTKIQAGSTLADLITTNKGDQTVVIPVIAKALDDLVAAGGMQAQMISNFGSDTTQVAAQLVAGTLGQAQNFLLPQLITGAAPTPPNGAGGAPPSGNFAPPSNTSTTDTTNTDTTSTTNNANTTSNASTTNNSTNTSTSPAATAVPQDETGSQAQGTTDATSEASPEGNTVTTADATPIIRPTRISFPTVTPTPVATEESTAESIAATGEIASNAATCSLIVDYNLNLRTQPITDGSTVLASIPFGSTVTSDGKTSDGWYHVSYDNQTGWIKGEYVTAGTSCSALSVSQIS